MDETKPWYASKGVWGGIIAAAAGVAGMLGYSISDTDVSTLTELISAGVATVAGLVAVIGRVVASHKIN